MDSKQSYPAQLPEEFSLVFQQDAWLMRPALFVCSAQGVWTRQPFFQDVLHHYRVSFKARHVVFLNHPLLNS